MSEFYYLKSQCMQNQIHTHDVIEYFNNFIGFTTIFFFFYFLNEKDHFFKKF